MMKIADEDDKIPRRQDMKKKKKRNKLNVKQSCELSN